MVNVMKKLSMKKLFRFSIVQLIFAVIITPFIVFWGPFSAIKTLAVGSISTSRHPQVLSLFLTQSSIDSILKKGNEVISAEGTTVQKTNTVTIDGITTEDISGSNIMGAFKGKVMLIKDPSKVHVATTASLGGSGEMVSKIASRLNAVAAINAGGFDDPNGKGNGGYPTGITLSNSQLIYNTIGSKKDDIIGLSSSGTLIVGQYSADQLMQMSVRDAVSFFPQLVKNGQGLITKGDGGWGVNPRTGIGQLSDGTIMFVVIDGRQIGTVGATLRDLQQVFLDYGAKTAANLDGGSSSTMVYKGQVINKPADIFGERYVPTAFIVTP